MDPRVTSIAEGALRRMGEPARQTPEAAGPPPSPPSRDPLPPRVAQEIPTAPPARPERRVFEAVLGAADPVLHPCLLEPDKPCANCSGRCETLGF